MTKYNDAINIVLQILGEQTLDENTQVTDVYEAEEADRVIENIKTEVLSSGWSFNTEESWTLLPDTDGYIVIPENMLRVDASETSSKYVRNDGKLYNTETKSYKFTDAVEVDVVWDVAFNDIPFAFQQYITLKAGRVLYQRLVGDTTTINLLIQDERDAKLNAMTHEDNVNDYNIFDNSQVARVISRNTNPTGLRG